MGTSGVDPGKGFNPSDLTAAIFERANLGFQLFAQVKAVDAQGGGALALGNGLLLVGSPRDDAGSLAVFEIDEGDLQVVSRTSAPPESLGFGTAIARSKGGLVAIGAPGGPIGSALSGSVHLYQLIAGNLVPVGPPVVGSNSAPGDGFGASIDISGTTLVVGAPGAEDTGAADLFELIGFGGKGVVLPSHLERLRAPDAQSGARFGASVAIDRDDIVVGAPGAGSSGGCTGAIYRFERTEFEEKLDAPPGIKELGADVAAADGEIAAGAPGTNSETGTALVTAPVFGWLRGVFEQTAIVNN